MKPRVYVVGAGPGDPELLTLKALKILKRADVVLYGRLVPREILDMAKESSTKIPVCSLGRQKALEIAAQSARAGKTVVWLKDGDPLIYGRTLEDCLALQKLGVECAIVPGVSSVTAAAARAGVPLTVRGSSISIVTGVLLDKLSKAAMHADTLVVLMPRERLDRIIEVISNSFNSKGTVVLVENATRPNERVHYIKLNGGCRDIREKVSSIRKSSSPVILFASRVWSKGLKNANEK